MATDRPAPGKRQSRSPRKGGLGRGLDALIPARQPEEAPPERTATPSSAAGAAELPVAAISPNPWQPRSPSTATTSMS